MHGYLVGRSGPVSVRRDWQAALKRFKKSAGNRYSIALNKPLRRGKIYENHDHSVKWGRNLRLARERSSLQWRIGYPKKKSPRPSAALRLAPTGLKGGNDARSVLA